METARQRDTTAPLACLILFMVALWANLTAEPVMMQIPLGGVARAAAMRTHSDLATGSAAPAFQLRDAEGRAQSLADWRGRYVLLYFTNDCTKCSLSSAPDWDTLAAERQDVELAVIAPVKTEELRRVKKRTGLQSRFSVERWFGCNTALPSRVHTTPLCFG